MASKELCLLGWARLSRLRSLSLYQVAASLCAFSVGPRFFLPQGVFARVPFLLGMLAFAWRCFLFSPGAGSCVSAWLLSRVPRFGTPMDCSPPDSAVCEILQARILEWGPCPAPGDLPDPGIKPASPATPALAGRFFTTEPPGKPSLQLNYRSI